MIKNPNKKAGNWGALKNKPQNQVYFKDGGKVKVTAGGEKHVIYKKTTKRGEGKVGNIMVNHPTKDKGIWDTIDLTKKAGAKTVQQGVAATKKWHKENPYNNMKKKLTKKQSGGPSHLMATLPSSAVDGRGLWNTTEGKENKLTGVRKRVNKTYFDDDLRKKEVIKYNPRTGYEKTRVKETGKKPKKTQVFLGKDTSTKRKKPVTPTIPPMNPPRPGEAPSTRYMKKGGSIKKKK